MAWFRPILAPLPSSDLLSKAIQKRVNSLWMLGGEIIRNLNETLHLRRVPVERLLADLIEDGSSLLCHGDSEDLCGFSCAR